MRYTETNDSERIQVISLAYFSSIIFLPIILIIRLIINALLEQNAIHPCFLSSK